MPPIAATVGARSAYLERNRKYWEQGYDAPSVNHPIFGFHDRVLKPEFNLPQGHEAVLDFGCGQGAAVNFFNTNGFNAFGVDISESDLSIAGNRYPHLRHRFHVCAADPAANVTYGPTLQYKVITAVESLHYLSRKDFYAAVKKLYRQLAPGGLFFATLVGERSSSFAKSQPTEDPWLRRTEVQSTPAPVDSYNFFVRDEDDLIDRFIFLKPLHVGYYAEKYRSDEGDGFHYTFCGIKE